MDFILFILSSIGLTFIVTQFYIFEAFRSFVMKKNKTLGKLFHCPACFGFWSGLFIRFIWLLKTNNGFNNIFTFSNIDIILYGFMASICSYTFYLIIKPLMDKYD